ncbi:uncharacterized protein [Triticum aestivum]|uniref:uncharacterized protein n=1 Tax=Triticum aestivum TaxID=4565 RepID=UPI001D013A15|nr:uncharacterized protein LOC123048621 [Triticum aestivum]
MATPLASPPLSIYTMLGLVAAGARGKTPGRAHGPAWRLVPRRGRRIRARSRPRPILPTRTPPQSYMAEIRTVDFAEEAKLVAQCHEQQRSGVLRFTKGFSAAIEGQCVDGDDNNKVAARGSGSNGEDVDRQQQHPLRPSAAIPQFYLRTKTTLIQSGSN